jgi:hypothetical protein
MTTYDTRTFIRSEDRISWAPGQNFATRIIPGSGTSLPVTFFASDFPAKKGDVVLLARLDEKNTACRYVVKYNSKSTDGIPPPNDWTLPWVTELEHAPTEEHP